MFNTYVEYCWMIQWWMPHLYPTFYILQSPSPAQKACHRHVPLQSSVGCCHHCSYLAGRTFQWKTPTSATNTCHINGDVPLLFQICLASNLPFFGSSFDELFWLAIGHKGDKRLAHCSLPICPANLSSMTVRRRSVMSLIPGRHRKLSRRCEQGHIMAPYIAIYGKQAWIWKITMFNIGNGESCLFTRWCRKNMEKHLQHTTPRGYKSLLSSQMQRDFRIRTLGGQQLNIPRWGTVQKAHPMIRCNSHHHLCIIQNINRIKYLSFI